MSQKNHFIKHISLVAVFAILFNLSLPAYASEKGKNDHKKEGKKTEFCKGNKCDKKENEKGHHENKDEDRDHHDKDDRDHENEDKKITICHIPAGNPENAHTITVSKKALSAHLKHGDTVGECAVVEPPVDPPVDPPVNEIFAKGVLTAQTQNGAQKGEAVLNISTTTFASILLTCTTWDACDLQLVRSAGINPTDLTATFDTGVLSAETCDANGTCAQNSSFILPAAAGLSMTFTFTDATGANGGDATIALDPASDKLSVSATAGVMDATGGLMSATGEADASADSTATIENFASTANGAAGALAMSSVSATAQSVAGSKNSAVADGLGALSASNDLITAAMTASVDHTLQSNGIGDGAMSSCMILSASIGDSLATLNALSQDGSLTADTVDHLETLNDPTATVMVSADCGEVQF